MRASRRARARRTGSRVPGWPPVPLCRRRRARGGRRSRTPGPGSPRCGPVRRALFPRLAGQGAAGHVALTFDDGPDPAATPGFLDLLDSSGAARHVLPARLHGGEGARARGRARRGRPRDRRARLGPPVPDAARPAGDPGRPDPGQRDIIASAYRPRPHAVPAALRGAERGRARHRARARPDPGAVDLLGPGMGAGRDARVGLRRAHRRPGGRGHGAAARLGLHLARRARRGPRWARCRCCSTSAPGAGYGSAPWASTASASRARPGPALAGPGSGQHDPARATARARASTAERPAGRTRELPARPGPGSTAGPRARTCPAARGGTLHAVCLRRLPATVPATPVTP